MAHLHRRACLEELYTPHPKKDTFFEEDYPIFQRNVTDFFEENILTFQAIVFPDQKPNDLSIGIQTKRIAKKKNE